jgi:hypothetical protein
VRPRERCLKISGVADATQFSSGFTVGFAHG